MTKYRSSSNSRWLSPLAREGVIYWRLVISRSSSSLSKSRCEQQVAKWRHEHRQSNNKREKKRSEFLLLLLGGLAPSSALLWHLLHAYTAQPSDSMSSSSSSSSTFLLLVDSLPYPFLMVRGEKSRQK